MNQSIFSDITMRHCHIATFPTCSLLVLLHLVLFLRFIFHLRQFRIQILKLAFANRLLFICIFYRSIHIWLNTRMTDLSGDIENIQPNSSQNFSICHWNLNSITVRSYVKISLLKASQFINLIQLVCQKHTSTSLFLYMMSIWNHRVTNQSDQTTHHNIKGVVYVSISEIPFH